MTLRSRNSPIVATAVGFMCALTFAACTDSTADSSAAPPSNAGLTEASATEATLAPTIAATTTIAPTTTSTTIPSTTSTTSTTTIAPVATIAHGNGPVAVAIDGTPLAPEVSATARQIYDAAVLRDYAAIKAIIGERRFRWGFVGQRRPADEWQKEFDHGGPDARARPCRSDN